MADLEVNWAAIDSAIEKGFKDTVYQYAQEVTKVISQPRFWAGFPDSRDIVDLGQLRASQVVEFSSPTEATVSYTADYALFVHNGTTRVTAGGKVLRISPRPFLRIAAEEMDITKKMAENVKYRIKKIR